MRLQKVLSAPRLFVAFLMGLPTMARNVAIAAWVGLTFSIGTTAFADGGGLPTFTDPISQDSFNQVANTMLKYLGLAVGAGLVVLVAVVSTMSAWKFVSKFIRA